MRPTRTALAGTTNLEKYTLEIILALLIKLWPASAKALAKNYQGSSAANTKIG